MGGGGGGGFQRPDGQSLMSKDPTSQYIFQMMGLGNLGSKLTGTQPPPVPEAGLEEDPTDLLKGVLAGQEKAMAGAGSGMPSREMYQAPERKSLASLINRPRGPAPEAPAPTPMAPGGRPGGL